MITTNQLIHKKKRFYNKRAKNKNLIRTPMRYGVVLKVMTKSPSRPNSANRKVARVRVKNLEYIKNLKRPAKFRSNKKMKKHFEFFAYIPGEGNDLEVSNIVAVKYSNLQDTPGVSYVCIRGKKDLLGVRDRKSSRSKYGVKKK